MRAGLCPIACKDVRGTGGPCRGLFLFIWWLLVRGCESIRILWLNARATRRGECCAIFRLEPLAVVAACRSVSS